LHCLIFRMGGCSPPKPPRDSPNGPAWAAAEMLSGLEQTCYNTTRCRCAQGAARRKASRPSGFGT
jgi:hypothetical protein